MTNGSRRFCCLLVVLGGGGVGCNAENGTGSVTAMVNVPACSYSGRTPVPLQNQSITGSWNHFTAEPSVGSARFPANQLNIRMQRSSARWEFADAVTFWILDSYEVARCTQLRMNLDGTPDWDPLLCDGSPAVRGPSGEGRVLIGTEREKVRSLFYLSLDTCSAGISATGLGDCADGSCPAATLCPGRGSWISFVSFGGAKASLSGSRSALKPDFKVDDGQTIEASAFHVELCDVATVQMTRSFVVPVVAPAVTGTVDGRFSFVLEP